MYLTVRNSTPVHPKFVLVESLQGGESRRLASSATSDGYRSTYVSNLVHTSALGELVRQHRNDLLMPETGIGYIDVDYQMSPLGACQMKAKTGGS